MEQKFSNNSLDLETLREFCKREGEAVTYHKGDQLEREGDPERWLAFVESGCFKYVNHVVSDDKAPIKREPSSSLYLAEREEDRPKVKAPIKREPSSSLDMAEREETRPKVKEHITWFSFEGEFVVDYPMFLYARPSQTTIVAMMPSRVIRVTGEQMKQFFSQNIETMELRAIIAEHLLNQFRSRYLDLHCTTARERYDLLMQRSSNTLTCRTLPRSSTSHRRCFPESERKSLSEQENNIFTSKR